MCEPTTIAMGVAAVVGAYGAHQQGQAQEEAAEYNARIQENRATAIENKGVEQEMEHRRRVQQLVSEQRAQFGAAGVNVESGSPLSIQEDTLVMGEADALRIRGNAQRQAQANRQGAALTQSQGEQAAWAGNVNATSTLIGGASDITATGVSDKWFSPKSAARQGGGMQMHNTSVNVPSAGF